MPLPTGLICLWSGAIGTIPTGWKLCDGNNGTPDLRNKFLLAAGGLYNPADTGGNTVHNHTFTGDGHSHQLSAGPLMAVGTDYSKTSTTNPTTGTTDNGSSLPPYFALAYIMKT